MMLSAVRPADKRSMNNGAAAAAAAAAAERWCRDNPLGEAARLYRSVGPAASVGAMATAAGSARPPSSSSSSPSTSHPLDPPTASARRESAACLVDDEVRPVDRTEVHQDDIKITSALWNRSARFGAAARARPSSAAQLMRRVRYTTPPPARPAPPKVAVAASVREGGGGPAIGGGQPFVIGALRERPDPSQSTTMIDGDEADVRWRLYSRSQIGLYDQEGVRLFDDDDGDGDRKIN